MKKARKTKGQLLVSLRESEEKLGILQNNPPP